MTSHTSATADTNPGKTPSPRPQQCVQSATGTEQAWVSTTPIPTVRSGPGRGAPSAPEPRPSRSRTDRNAQKVQAGQTFPITSVLNVMVQRKRVKLGLRAQSANAQTSERRKRTGPSRGRRSFSAPPPRATPPPSTASRTRTWRRTLPTATASPTGTDRTAPGQWRHRFDFMDSLLAKKKKTNCCFLSLSTFCFLFWKAQRDNFQSNVVLLNIFYLVDFYLLTALSNLWTSFYI